MLLFKVRSGEDDLLPHPMPDKLHTSISKTTSFGGLCRQEAADADSLCVNTNLSPALSPALSTRASRRRYMSGRQSQTPHGFSLHGDDIVCCLGTGLYLIGESRTYTPIGTAAATDKQFLSFGQTLFVLPDKLYWRSGMNRALSLTIAASEVMTAVVDGDRLYVSNADFLRDGYAVGDGIRIEATAGTDYERLTGYYKIARLSAANIYVKGTFPVSGTFSVRISRPMPDLDGACVVGDRVYGFRNNGIFVCEAGNPFNWYAADPDNAENAPVSFQTGTDTPFTACIAWQGYPTFFKQDRICRLVGRSTGYTSDTARTSSLALSDLPAPGVGKGMAATLCEVGGALYYCADCGIYRYAGSYPTRIDGELAGHLSGRCAGTDGRGYYLSCAVNNSGRMLLYRPDMEKQGGWFEENGMSLCAMSKRAAPLASGQGSACLVQKSDGSLWAMRSFAPAITSGTTEAEAGSAYTSTAEFGDDLTCMPKGGRLLSVTLRAKGGTGAEMTVKCRREDSDTWDTLDKLSGTGRTDLYRIPVLPHAAGWYRLRLEMSGDWTVYDIWREVEQIQ